MKRWLLAVMLLVAFVGWVTGGLRHTRLRWIFVGTATPWSAWDEARDKRVTLQFKDAPLEDVLNAIHQQTGLEIIDNRDAALSQGAPRSSLPTVSCEILNQPLELAVELLCQEAKLEDTDDAAFGSLMEDDRLVFGGRTSRRDTTLCVTISEGKLVFDVSGKANTIHLPSVGGIGLLNRQFGPDEHGRMRTSDNQPLDVALGDFVGVTLAGRRWQQALMQLSQDVDPQLAPFGSKLLTLPADPDLLLKLDRMVSLKETGSRLEIVAALARKLEIRWAFGGADPLNERLEVRGAATGKQWLCALMPPGHGCRVMRDVLLVGPDPMVSDDLRAYRLEGSAGPLNEVVHEFSKHGLVVRSGIHVIVSASSDDHWKCQWLLETLEGAAARCMLASNSNVWRAKDVEPAWKRLQVNVTWPSHEKPLGQLLRWAASHRRVPLVISAEPVSQLSHRWDPVSDQPLWSTLENCLNVANMPLCIQHGGVINATYTSGLAPAPSPIFAKVPELLLGIRNASARRHVLESIVQQCRSEGPARAKPSVVLSSDGATFAAFVMPGEAEGLKEALDVMASASRAEHDGQPNLFVANTKQVRRWQRFMEQRAEIPFGSVAEALLVLNEYWNVPTVWRERARILTRLRPTPDPARMSLGPYPNPRDSNTDAIDLVAQRVSMPKLRVNGDLPHATLGAALTDLLAPHDLAWDLAGDGLHIRSTFLDTPQRVFGLFVQGDEGAIPPNLDFERVMSVIARSHDDEVHSPTVIGGNVLLRAPLEQLDTFAHVMESVGMANPSPDPVMDFHQRPLGNGAVSVVQRRVSMQDAFMAIERQIGRDLGTFLPDLPVPPVVGASDPKINRGRPVQREDFVGIFTQPETGRYFPLAPDCLLLANIPADQAVDVLANCYAGRFSSSSEVLRGNFPHHGLQLVAVEWDTRRIGGPFHDNLLEQLGSQLGAYGDAVCPIGRYVLLTGVTEELQRIKTLVRAAHGADVSIESLPGWNRRLKPFAEPPPTVWELLEAMAKDMELPLAIQRVDYIADEPAPAEIGRTHGDALLAIAKATGYPLERLDDHAWLSPRPLGRHLDCHAISRPGRSRLGRSQVALKVLYRLRTELWRENLNSVATAIGDSHLLVIGAPELQLACAQQLKWLDALPSTDAKTLTELLFALDAAPRDSANSARAKPTRAWVLAMIAEQIRNDVWLGSVHRPPLLSSVRDTFEQSENRSEVLIAVEILNHLEDDELKLATIERRYAEIDENMGVARGPYEYSLASAALCCGREGLDWLIDSKASLKPHAQRAIDKRFTEGDAEVRRWMLLTLVQSIQSEELRANNGDPHALELVRLIASRSTVGPVLAQAVEEGRITKQLADDWMCALSLAPDPFGRAGNEFSGPDPFAPGNAGAPDPFGDGR